MELVDVWQAHGDSGSDQWRGPVIAYCSTEAQANLAAERRGWYGGHGGVSKARGLKIDGQVWLLAREEPIDLDSLSAKQDEELRERTLAGLSSEQRRVLGL